MNSSMQIKNAEDLYTAGNYAVTANICESLLKENPDDYQALLLLGKALCACGEMHQALPYLRKTVDGCPDNMQALLQLGRALRLARKPGEAINYLKRALVSGRDYHVLLELGLSFFDANQYEEARTYLLDALSCRPDCRVSIVHLGKIAQALGDEGLALDYFSRLIEQQPDNLLSYPGLIEALLVTGQPARAVELCDRALLIEPACTPLFSLKYLALTESGDDEGAAYLYDYEKLVKRSAAEIPEVFADVGDLNSFLTNHIMTNVSETMRPEDHSTMNGWQSDIGKLFERNEFLGKQVEKTINTALDKYIAELSVDPGHPVNIGRPSDRHIEAWSVVLHEQGFQEPHLHPRSWLSGVYYVQVPDDMEGAQEAGWLAFGRGRSEFHKLRQPEVASYEAVEGSITVFPSYFWHHTIPFSSCQDRISIAFDLVPTKGWGK